MKNEIEINDKTMKDEIVTYKVRCARTYAWYEFVEAIDAKDAEDKCINLLAENGVDPETEATHIHDTVEVEECE